MQELNISIDANSKGEFIQFLVLSHQVVFPYNITPALVFDRNSEATERAMKEKRLIAVFPQMPEDNELEHEPEAKLDFESFNYHNHQISKVGTLCRIVKKLQFPDGTTRVLLRGLKRIRLVNIAQLNGIDQALYTKVIEPMNNEIEIEGLKKAAIRSFTEASILAQVPEELKIALLNLRDPSRVADLLAEALQLSFPEKLMLLNLIPVRDRLFELTILLNRNLEVLRVGTKIQNDVHQSMSKAQREYFLREQVKTIQKELGEDNRNPDIIDIEKRLDDGDYPDTVVETVEKELSRLEIIPQASPDYHVTYNYIDALLNVPWLNHAPEQLDALLASKVLDEDHYGLKDVKERILEFLAVLQLKKDRKSPILCLVGPPGVGKTSLGKSVARALNRPFIRMALGGVRDEAEIRGHRRTYIGAMPGRIIQNMRKVGVNNPVFMLDELDKISHDVHGDPASALLEVLDPAQNSAFNDHYLELDYDLSKVFFIATANVIEAIPAPLLDRMEVVRIPGYTAFEKREIALRYLVVRQKEENGLKPHQLKFTSEAIDELVDSYTREAGVRELERVIGRICRKIARRIVDGEQKPTARVTLTPKLIHTLLGGRKYLLDLAQKHQEPGSATGMAWTSCGGVILTVEALKYTGKGALKLTGSLGKVMQESAEAAFSYIKSAASEYGVNPEVFDKNDFHIHVPDGATPKDGPSAGITMATALLSLLTGRKSLPYLSMTGEITLHGKVTAIGGVKEKVLAALQAGVKDIILPEENRKDLEEVPEEVRKQLKFHFVSKFKDLVKISLEKPSK